MSTTIHTDSATSLDWEAAFPQDASAQIQLPCTLAELQAAMSVFEAELSELVVTSAGHADGRDVVTVRAPQPERVQQLAQRNVTEFVASDGYDDCRECGYDLAHHTNGINCPWS